MKALMDIKLSLMASYVQKQFESIDGYKVVPYSFQRTEAERRH
jgi:hypothetical protein